MPMPCRGFDFMGMPMCRWECQWAPVGIGKPVADGNADADGHTDPVSE